MEADEVQEFANQVKEGGEPLKIISLGISILAVLVAMVTVLSGCSDADGRLVVRRRCSGFGRCILLGGRQLVCGKLKCEKGAEYERGQSSNEREAHVSWEPGARTD